MKGNANDQEHLDQPPMAISENDLPPVKSHNGNSGFRSYLRVFTYNDRLGWCLNALAFPCMIAAGTMLPLMDIVFGQFVTVFNNFAIGVLSPEAYREEVKKYTLWFIYLFIAKFVLSYAWTLLISMSAIRTTKNLRIAYLRQTLRQEIAYFDSAEAGSISGHVTTNGNLINHGVSEKLGLTIQGISSFVTAFIIALAVQWKLALITICIVPTILVVTVICVGIDMGHENAMMATFAKAGQLAEEVFSSIRTVHAFWAYKRMSSKYEGILEDAKKIGMKKGPNYAILFSIEFFCVFSGYGLAFWQGIRMYQSGEVTQPGAIVTVIFAVIVAAQALTQIAPQTIAISKAAAAAQELFETIDRDSRIDSLSEGGIRSEDCEGSIELRDVAFSYPARPDVQILKGLSLSIPANTTTAIVGASGSGKSTIVGLIERWFNPADGTITLDGTELSEYNIQWLRTRIRLVQQEPTLFNGTVFQNVVYGLAGTSLADLSEAEKEALVEDACRAAYAHDFISQLPHGYHTKIGERGAMLSGGQKQRIVIARSIISNPKVLLLDEATSALDPRAEQIVQKALDNVAVGRTMLVIAHRLSTIRNANNIVVMSNGDIVEQGTHNQLINLGGAYSKLVKAQDLGNQEDEDTERSEKEVDGGAPLATRTTSVPNNELETHEPDSKGKAVRQLSLLKCLAVVTREQRGLWPALFIVGVTCVMGGATFPALAVIFSRTMDAFALPTEQMTSTGNFYSLMFLIVALGNLVAYAALGWFMNLVAQVVIKHYRLEIFDNLLRQRMAFFDEPENTTGAMVSRLSTEPTHLQDLISFNVGLIVINIVNVISSCILSITFGWKLGLVLVFAALPPLVYCGYLRIRLEFKLDNETSARFADSAGIASEAVLAIRTVSSLALEQEIISKFEESLQCIATKSIGSLGWNMFWYALTQSLSFLAMALGFWYGGQLVSTGEYTPSQFYVVFIAVIFSGEAAAQFFQYTTSITKARVAANYIFQLRARVPSSMTEDPQSDDEKTQKGGVAVECNDVEFAYPQRPNTKVVRGVNAEIQPGQFAAFVGASGCGKTTMISLFERFYEPSSGSVCYDGQDIQSMHLGQYRSNIALVQQEPVLYQGSIRENIALGIDKTESREPVSDEQILEACRQANIDVFVASLPEGLSTPCGFSGLQLSGGQRQRIAIARALIRKPRLLLLDEATSSLDTESERIVQAALEAAAKGEGHEKGRLRSTVAVAHRLSTIKGADKIFVFSKGQIVECGTHEQLLERKGMYHDMCLGQSLDRAV